MLHPLTNQDRGTNYLLDLKYRLAILASQALKPFNISRLGVSQVSPPKSFLMIGFNINNQRLGELVQGIDRTNETRPRTCGRHSSRNSPVIQIS